MSETICLLQDYLLGNQETLCVSKLDEDEYITCPTGNKISLISINIYANSSSNTNVSICLPLDQSNLFIENITPYLQKICAPSKCLISKNWITGWFQPPHYDANDLILDATWSCTPTGQGNFAFN